MVTRVGYHSSRSFEPAMSSAHSCAMNARPRCGWGWPEENAACSSTCCAKAAASCSATDCAKLISRFQTAHSSALSVGIGAAASAGAQAASATHSVSARAMSAWVGEAGCARMAAPGRGRCAAWCHRRHAGGSGKACRERRWHHRRMNATCSAIRGLRLALCLAASLGLLACSRPAEPAPVLLVSLDGFRADYLDRGHTPNLARLAREGVHARWMVPSYPSLTFPNHYTLVTGLRPDRHGIVHNTMADPVLGTFNLSAREAVGDGRWWGGEPIWITAQRAGVPTATLFWPGSEAAIDGVRPTRWRPYDHD